MKRNRTLLIHALGLSIAAVEFARGDDAPPPSGVVGAARAFAKTQIERGFQAMNRPFEPLRIVGPLYYVGASNVASYLIVTPEGHILIDSGFGSTVPMIRDNIAQARLPV